MVHGEEAAKAANDAAMSIFGGGGTANMPEEEVDASVIGDGINVLDLLTQVNLIPSKGEGRRLIQQNGLSINNEKVTAVDMTITKDMFDDGMVVKKGKKTFLKIVLK